MPEFYYNDGSGVRKVKEFYYNDGSAVRKIKEGWYNDGSGVRKFYTSSDTVASFSAWHLEGDAVSGTATASITFHSDGTVTGFGVPSDVSSSGSTAYLNTTGTGLGASYWIRATATSGSITSGVVGSWLQLNTDWTWTKSGTLSGSVTLTFEIATDSLGASIVLTSTGNTLVFARS